MNQIWETNKSKRNGNMNRFVCIYDNSAYHKSHLVREYLEKSKVCMLTIPTYMPCLNLSEHIIQAIKGKVKSKQAAYQ